MPKNPIRLKPNKSKGETPNMMYNKLVIAITREIKKHEREGKIGIKNTISKELIKDVIRRVSETNRWLYKTDKIDNYAYQKCLETAYHRIVNGYLQNPDKENVFFYKGLITNNGKGVYLTRTDKEVNDYKKRREHKLEEYGIKLEHRCVEAKEFVKSLPEHISPESLKEHDGNDRDKDVA